MYTVYIFYIVTINGLIVILNNALTYMALEILVILQRLLEPPPLDLDCWRKLDLPPVVIIIGHFVTSAPR